MLHSSSEKRREIALDTEKVETGSHVEDVASIAGSRVDIGDKVAVRKLLLKLDLCILPFAILLYLSAYLDRGNMGNARLQGLQATVLDGSDTNYSIALCCFFMTYILLSTPGTLLAQHFNPSHSIAAGAMIWSIAATCQAACVNPAGIFTCRLFIGVGEALFGQAMTFHLSMWYSRKDLAKRIGCFISSGAVAGAFGGLIAYGVSSLHGTRIAQWRILFLIEGCPSIVLAICVAFFMPSRPETSRLLSGAQKDLCIARLEAENLIESRPGIDWRGVKRSLTDWKTYVICICYSCINMGLGSVGGFLPTIVKDLGYTNAQAQLYTVPPYVAALGSMFLVTGFSDARQSRGFPIACVFAMGAVGWALLLSIDAQGTSVSHLRARYFGCVCVAAAGYSANSTVMAWQSSNTGNKSQRATSLGMLNTVGQCLSIAAAFMFPTVEGPQYRKGCIINLCFQVLGLVIAFGMSVYYRLENKRRDKMEGGSPSIGSVIDSMNLYDLAPGFRYVP